MSKIQRYGKKSRLHKALMNVRKLCRRKKGFVCVNMTYALEKDLKRKGLLM